MLTILQLNNLLESGDVPIVKVIDETMDLDEEKLVRRKRTQYERKIVAIGY